MRVVITGSAGQLGFDVQRTYQDATIVAMDRATLDLTDRQRVHETIADISPDLVINCAAHTAVDKAETDTEAAWAINAFAPLWIAEACRDGDIPLVHVSTDYVFDGLSGRPYHEFDQTGPASIYGITKEAGERNIRNTWHKHHIVRTAWVLGEHGNNFVKTMMRLGAERDHLTVVDDQMGTPTFTMDLAPRLRAIAETGIYGTWHATNSGVATWYELAAAIFARLDYSVDLAPTDTLTYNAPAPRPRNSILDNLMARQAGLPAMPQWQDSLDILLARLTEAASTQTPGSP